MSIQSRIVGGVKRNEAVVTELGEVAVSPLFFSKFYNGATAANDVPVNIVPPKHGMIFIIKAIILSGDRSIGASGAVTALYENNTSGVDTVQESVIITEEIGKQTRMVVSGVNIAVTQGKWVNLVSDDVIVRCNIEGYYVNS